MLKVQQLSLMKALPPPSHQGEKIGSEDGGIKWAEMTERKEVDPEANPHTSVYK
jgi:hypothetical protein